MAMTVGRLANLRPKTVSRSGDSLSFAGVIEAGTADALKARLQQLSGLVGNPDEPVVPVTWDADPSVDGYWYVESASAERLGPEDTAKFARVNMALRKIGGGWVNPVIEIALLAPPTLTNAHAQAGQVYVFFPWDGSPDYTILPGGFSSGTRPTETGGVAGTWAASGAAVNTTVAYYTPAASYYNGSCRFEVLIGGTWYPLIGRQVPPWVTVTGWRISNGTIRFTPVHTGGTRVMRMEQWNNPFARWDVVADLRRTIVGSNRPFAQADPTSTNVVGSVPYVARNSPERVVVVIPQINGTVESWELTRGNQHAFVRMMHGGSVADLGIAPLTSIAFTDVTIGGVATANDANGWKLGIYTPVANDVNVTTGLVDVTPSLADTTWMVAQVNSSGILSTDAERFAAVGMVQQVVAR